MNSLEINKARFEDAAVIAQLLNSAYRGESSRQGWTTEVDILDGLRTTTQEIVELTQRDDVLMLKGTLGHEIVATICCELHTFNGQNTAHFGMITVAPSLQNQGYGKQMIQTAELMTQNAWQVRQYQLSVITLRHELIAFYQRLGYLPNGEFKDFPQNSALWQPKVKDLRLQYLVKNLT